MLSRVKYLGILMITLLISSACQPEENNTKNLPPSITPSPKQSSKNSRELPAPVDVTFQFIPCGAMGDAMLGENYVKITPNASENPRPGDTDNRSVKFEYKQTSKDKWAGWYWLYPDCNWGEEPGTKITGAKKIIFWARGERGGELIKIKVGGVKEQEYKDKLDLIKQFELTNKWQEYTINIPNPDKNLENVIGAFAWIAEKESNPQGLVFYLDEIQYVGQEENGLR